MDKTKKETLEELMRQDGENVTAAEDQADAIDLEEPKKRTWLVVLLSVLATLLVAGGAYVAFQSYKADKQLTAEEKIETPATQNAEQPVVSPTTTSAQSVYITASEGLNMRKEANSASEVLKIVPFGTKLVVLETSGDWYKTTYDGATGWIAKLFTASDDPLVYKNTTYGFQITFPSTWAYKFFPIKSDGTDTTAVYFVGIPTTDKNIDESAGGVDKGYYTLFAISVYTPSQWDAAKATGGPIPTLAVQNANYIVAYTPPNGIPATDLTARIAEVKSVLATIKFY